MTKPKPAKAEAPQAKEGEPADEGKSEPQPSSSAEPMETENPTEAIGSKYTEVTQLWGEMKSIAAATSSMRFDQELLDAVLYTFVRSGFFSRANEVVEMMEKKDIFVDKYKYRMLFLKYHKTAYKGKAPKVQSESQLKKREAGLVFKKWLGLS